MIGSIAGDIIGSIYEFENIKTTRFPLFQDSCFFTDDTVLSVALAESILTGENYENLMRDYYLIYPNAGYGGKFRKWATGEIQGAYNSWGNGAAMRISPVGWAYDDLDTVLKKAEEFTVITHDHPEGIKGAKAVASAIWLARKGHSKSYTKMFVSIQFGYDLSRTCNDIRPEYTFNESCQGTVPEAITAFLEGSDFESCVRLAVSLGGDTDTLACITGSIAEAFYGIPTHIADKAMEFLDDELKAVTVAFMNKYGEPK